LLAQYLEKHWTDFHETFSINAFWNNDEHFSFGVRGQSSRSRWSNLLRNALLALLMQYLENYWTEFHQTFSIVAFWERVNVWGRKFKG